MPNPEHLMCFTGTLIRAGVSSEQSASTRYWLHETDLVAGWPSADLWLPAATDTLLADRLEATDGRTWELARPPSLRTNPRLRTASHVECMATLAETADCVIEAPGERIISGTTTTATPTTIYDGTCRLHPPTAEVSLTSVVEHGDVAVRWSMFEVHVPLHVAGIEPGQTVTVSGSSSAQAPDDTYVVRDVVGDRAGSRHVLAVIRRNARVPT